MIEVNKFGIEPVERYSGYIVIEILDKQKLELIERFIETLEACKCGIKSHEFKVNHTIKEWERYKP